MRTNKVISNNPARLAGGMGMIAAKQSPEALLRRSVLACLLGEDIAYSNGESVIENIINLIPHVKPEDCASIAIEARQKQNLRHVPLLIAREMVKYNTHKKYLGELLPRIIQRADEITEFMSLYWQQGKIPIAKQVKIGLSRAFDKFDAYQFAKYDRQTDKIKFRDVLFLIRAKPRQGKEELYKQIANNRLPLPDTWEVALSAGKDKRETWKRLILERKLGMLAFLRNMKNMVDVSVPSEVIKLALESAKIERILPLNFFAAAEHCPKYTAELEKLMLRSLNNFSKLSGRTILVVDVSGSMGSSISQKSKYTRLTIASTMACMAKEVCECVDIYVTAGNDRERKHRTELVPAELHGFRLAKQIESSQKRMGGGGIFTRQCLDYIHSQTQNKSEVERIIVFSDSQDCDRCCSKLPSPFGRRNYIIDISCERRGINYEGIWTAEIGGWSEHFLTYIAEFEQAKWGNNW